MPVFVTLVSLIYYTLRNFPKQYYKNQDGAECMIYKTEFYDYVSNNIRFKALQNSHMFRKLL